MYFFPPRSVSSQTAVANVFGWRGQLTAGVVRDYRHSGSKSGDFEQRNSMDSGVLKHHTVFDGDLLYTRKLNELFPAVTRSAKYARKDALEYVVDLFEEQTNQALANHHNYVYEGHFTNDATWEKPKAFKEAGYRLHMIFFGLENPELSQFRVTERVTEGGHYVDPQTLNNNFYGNLEKLNIYHPLIDDLTIVDTSEINHRILFKSVMQQIEFHVEREELPIWFIDRLPAIVQLFS